MNSARLASRITRRREIAQNLGFANRGSSVNSILSVVTAGTMVLFVIGASVRHIMARNLDWFRFWLKGEEDAAVLGRRLDVKLAKAS